MLPINNYGESRKEPLNLFSATANRRKFLFKKRKKKRIRRVAKGGNLFLSNTANRKIGLDFCRLLWRIAKKVLIFFCRLRRIRNKCSKRIFRFRQKKRPQQKESPAASVQNLVLRCAQPASRRMLLRKNGYFDPNVEHQRSSTTSN